ncbi:MAG: hypothetical protein WCR23_04090 [Planctomycetota bacterium]|jgi:hypothetical protein|nr:hypothetical protein [Planctomycetia bacterium]RLS32557.1 MAG: hypothetical protein DWH80_01590 [Planctomycetota bacterium]RLS54422.1 MAG: hypothetical protein DWH94_10845 [Planctomycetota bacterium]TSA08442.1 MAG: hypothetical protein D4R77_02765 [Planctomycetaceae bacterium]
MKVGDLSSGGSKLALALKHLEIKWESAKESWDDATSRAFHKEYIETISPDVKETLEAIGRLSEVLSRASRDVADFGVE